MPRNADYRFGELAQNNYLNWKEDDTVPANTGRGNIPCENEALLKEGELVTLSHFAATEKMRNGI